MQACMISMGQGVEEVAAAAAAVAASKQAVQACSLATCLLPAARHGQIACSWPWRGASFSFTCKYARLLLEGACLFSSPALSSTPRLASALLALLALPLYCTTIVETTCTSQASPRPLLSCPVPSRPVRHAGAIVLKEAGRQAHTVRRNIHGATQNNPQPQPSSSSNKQVACLFCSPCRLHM